MGFGGDNGAESAAEQEQKREEEQLKSQQKQLQEERIRAIRNKAFGGAGKPSLFDTLGQTLG